MWRKSFLCNASKKVFCSFACSVCAELYFPYRFPIHWLFSATNDSNYLWIKPKFPKLLPFRRYFFQPSKHSAGPWRFLSGLHDAILDLQRPNCILVSRTVIVQWVTSVRGAGPSTVGSWPGGICGGNFAAAITSKWGFM